MPNAVTIRTTAPGAKQTAGEIKSVRDALQLMQTQGAKGFMIGASAAITTAAIGAVGSAVRHTTEFIGDSIGAASDLNETMTKSQQIFGDAAGEVEAWGDSASTAFGQSKKDAIDAASGFAGLFQTVGLAAVQAKDYAIDLTELGSDLASFFNTDVQTALDSLKSGLAGESEPLRKFNVFLSETAVAAKAVELGFEKVNGKFTEGEKIQARYAIIMEQTSVAQGDFARTSDGLANTQRTLDAQMEDLHATMGQALLPVMQKLVGGVSDVLAIFQSLSPEAQQLITAIAGLVAVGAPALIIFNQFKGAFGSIFGVMGQVTGAFRTHTAATVADTTATEANVAAQGRSAKALGLLGPVAAGVTAGLIGIDQATQKVAEHTAPLIEHIEGMSEAEREAARTSEVLGMNAAELSGGMADLIDLVGLVAPGFNSASTGMRGVADAAAEAVYGFDNVALATHAATERAEELMAPIAEVADEIGTTLPSALAGGTRSVQAFATMFGQSLDEVAEDAGDAGREITDNLSDALRANKDDVADAMSDLVFAMNHPLKQAKELARIEGALSSRALADGLASESAYVAEQARQTRERLIAQWESLSGRAYDAGEGAGEQVGEGIDDSTPRAVRQAAQLAAAVNAALASIRSTVKVDVKGRYFGKSLPGLAKGGPVEAGEPYLVNEDTPNSEVFVPKVSGTIVPRNKVNEGQHMAPFAARDDRTPSRIDVHVNLSTREFAQMQKHYAVVGGGPAFR